MVPAISVVVLEGPGRGRGRVGSASSPHRNSGPPRRSIHTAGAGGPAPRPGREIAAEWLGANLSSHLGTAPEGGRPGKGPNHPTRGCVPLHELTPADSSLKLIHGAQGGSFLRSTSTRRRPPSVAFGAESMATLSPESLAAARPSRK